jgi:hypothetical protein
MATGIPQKNQPSIFEIPLGAPSGAMHSRLEAAPTK